MLGNMDVDQVFVGTLVDTPTPGTLRVQRDHLMGELRSCHHHPFTTTSRRTSGRAKGPPLLPVLCRPSSRSEPCRLGDIAVADPLRFANATPIAIPIVITIANPSDIVISPQRARLHPPCPPRFPPHFRRDPLRPTGPDPLPTLAHLPPTHIHRPAHPRPAIPLRRNRPRPPPDAVVGPVRVSGRRACGRGSNRGGTGG